MRICLLRAACFVIYSSLQLDDFVYLGDFRGFVVVIAPSIGDFIDRDSL